MIWDYIVIGAGSAGCALAHELASGSRGAKILVVEAGGLDRSPWIRFAASQVQAVARHDWGYRSQPDPSRNGASESWPRGKVIGGSSSINGTMYVRGAAEDFDRWAMLCGNARDWTAPEVMPLFRELEASDQPGVLRGRNGLLHVRTVRHAHQTTDLFLQAAVSCGYLFNDDYNDRSQEGVGYAQLSQRGGVRWSAADAFLKPLVRNKIITLRTDAVVQRIELTDSRADAAVFSSRNRQFRERARDVILCAGAIDSPKLLMLSGIGCAQELSEHRISVKLDLPGVGRNLREHPLVKLIYRTRIPTHNLTAGLLQKIRIARAFMTTGEGPISNLFEGAAFLRSSADQPSPDIQLHFMPFGFVTGQDGINRLADFPSVTVLLNKSRPLSKGRIRLASSNPADPALIECRLFENIADAVTLRRGVEVVRRIMQEQPIAHVVEGEVSPGPNIHGEEHIDDYIYNNTGIAFHPAGTCRMGTDAEAVVGPDLRVHGVSNLWIADASIMPDLIAGNTNAACMMIGLKLGKQLGARDGRRH